MQEKFSDNLTRYICKYHSYTDMELVKIDYGFKVLYTILSKTLGILILALILNTLIETVTLMILYSALRFTGHGIHLNSSKNCWIFSLICYGCFPLLIKYYSCSFLFIFIVSIFSLISFMLWAPADTKNKPIINTRKRRFLKIFTCLNCIILIIFSIYFNNRLLSNSIIFAFIMQIIAICPVTYKLFNMPYNNYKSYRKE